MGEISDERGASDRMPTHGLVIFPPEWPIWPRFGLINVEMRKWLWGRNTRELEIIRDPGEISNYWK